MKEYRIDEDKIFYADLETKINLILAITISKHSGGMTITDDYTPLFTTLLKGGYLKEKAR